MHDDIIWNSISISDLGIEHIGIEKVPARNRPARKTNKYSIPGRSGDIIISEYAWENYDQDYNIYISTGVRGEAEEAAGKVAEWLSSPLTEVTNETIKDLCSDGYFWLQDSFEQDLVRLASLRNSYSMEDILRKVVRLAVTFDCRPERYLLSGFQPTTIMSSGTIINNPTKFRAKPFIKVYASGTGLITIGSRSVRLLKTPVDYLHIDSESENAWRSSYAEDRNDYIQAAEFPLLDPGDNTVSFSGDVTKIEIYPRFWTI